MRGILNCVAVKAPDFGDRKKAILEDIAVLTGAQVVSKEKGMRLDKFSPDWLGKANKATVSKDETTIIDAQGEPGSIEEKIEEIKTQIEESNSPYEKETLQNRLAKFIGGVAIVHVGGHTEVEMKEKKDRVDDALAATRAAVEAGIIPGGGVAYIRAAEALDENSGENEDENTGIKIVQKVKEGKGDFGFNARTDKFESLYKSGVIDPTKVSRSALENAASIASMLLTTECVVADEPEDEMPAPPMGGGMPGGMPGMM